MADDAAVLPPAEQQAAWARQHRGQRLQTLRLGRLTGTNPLMAERTTAAVAPRAFRRFFSSQVSSQPQSLDRSFDAERQALNTPQDDPAAEQQRQDRVRQIRRGSSAERFVRLQSLRAARSRRQNTINPAEAAAAQEISNAATQAYTTLWQRAHEVIEGLSFQFFMIAALIAGPLAVGMFIVRFFIGNAFEGGTKIQFRDVSVPLVPPMSPTEIIYRGSKNGFIAIVFTLEWTIIVVAVYVVQHPDVALKLGFAAVATVFQQALGVAHTVTGI